MAKNLLLLSGVIFCLAANNVSAGVSDGWEKHVMGDMTSPIYLYVTDMDGDGDLDAVATSTMHPGLFDSEVAWYQNNLNEDGQWEKIIVSSKEPDENPITNTNGIVVSDIDGDGNEDVIVCTGRVTEITGDVYWFKAPDEPAGQWERFDIEVGVMNSYFKIYTVDANEDEVNDIIVGGNQGAMLFINPGNPDQQGAVWEKIALPEDLGETGSSLYLDDLNEDGKTDLLNTYTGAVTDDPGNVSWFELSYNSAEAEVVFDRTMIAPELIRAFDVNCVDVNEDSKKDVIVTVFQQPFIYWYEAPENSGGIWTQHLISDDYEGTDIFTGDINKNGKDDVIISGLFQNKISWFEYNVSQQSWTVNPVDDDITFPGDISLDDLDNDGDLDIVLAGMGVDQMIWYENKLATQAEQECELNSITPRSVKTGLGILPRFNVVTIVGNDFSDFNADSTVEIEAEGVTVLYSTAVDRQTIQAFIMTWGAEKGTYNVSADSCSGITFTVE